jgi:hypothetical protein
MKQSEFDKKVAYTLRIELANSKVLLYPIDTKNKNQLTASLKSNSVGSKENTGLNFLFFKTSLERFVMVNTNAFISVTFCFDFNVYIENPHAYRDNFKVVEKDVEIEETKNGGNEGRLFVSETLILPQLIIFHNGQDPEVIYNKNPLTFSELDIGCLGQLSLELNGSNPLRQFIGLIDNNGEETFIPIGQIIVMEFDRNLLGN